jgi:hypothetical protein
MIPVTLRLVMPLHPLLQKRWLQVLLPQVGTTSSRFIASTNDGGAHRPTRSLGWEESKKDRKEKWKMKGEVEMNSGGKWANF